MNDKLLPPIADKADYVGFVDRTLKNEVTGACITGRINRTRKGKSWVAEFRSYVIDFVPQDESQIN